MTSRRERPQLETLDDAALVQLVRALDGNRSEVSYGALEVLLRRYTEDAVGIGNRSGRHLATDERESVYGEVLLRCIMNFDVRSGEFHRYLRSSLRKAMIRESYRARRDLQWDPYLIEPLHNSRNRLQLIADAIGDTHEEGIYSYVRHVAVLTIDELRNRKWRLNGTARLRADVANDFLLKDKSEEAIRADRNLSKGRFQDLFEQFLNDARTTHRSLMEKEANQ